MLQAEAVRYAPYYRTSWALVVGISDYLYMPPLSCATNDATDVAHLLVARLGFPQDQVLLLLNKQAARENILAAFDTTLNRHNLAPDDRLLIFFAGHGVTRQTHNGPNVGYIAPIEAQPTAWRTLIRMSDLIDQARFLPAKHILFILDACYSGLSFYRGSMPDLMVEHFVMQRAVQLITAGKDDEQVADGGDRTGNNSVFTRALLDAWLGEAATATGLMTASDVMQYVYRRVISQPDARQTPQFGWLDGNGDFVFQFPRQRGLEPVLEVALRQGSVPARLYAINELTDIASSGVQPGARLAVQRLYEIAERDPDPRVAHMARLVLGVERDRPLLLPLNDDIPPAPLEASTQPAQQPAAAIARGTEPVQPYWGTLATLIMAAAIFLSTLTITSLTLWREHPPPDGSQGTSTTEAALTSAAEHMTIQITPDSTLATSIPTTVLHPATATAALDLVPEGAEVLFQDDFSAPADRWYESPNNTEAVWEVSDGEMVFTVNKPINLWIARPRRLTVSSAFISTDTRLITDIPSAGFGLIFYLRDYDNYFYYRIGANGTASLILHEQGDRRYLLPPTPLDTLPRTTIHRLGVDLEGAKIALFYDGIEVATLRHNLWYSGQVGLSVESGLDAPVSVAFDNFVAYMR